MDGMGWGGVRTGWQDGQDGLGVGADRMSRMGRMGWGWVETRKPRWEVSPKGACEDRPGQ